MTRFALLALACLAGCANDPQRVIDSGRMYEYSTGMTPRRLAQCTALNAANFSGPYTSEVQSLVRPDNYAVVVIERTPSSYRPFIVARTMPTADGSRMEVFMDADIGRASDADWLARLRMGCDSVRTAGVLVPVRGIVPVERRPAPAPVAPEPVLRGRPRG